MQMLRLPEVLARSGYSRTVLYRRMAAGLFPKQIFISDRAVAWPDTEVDKVMSFILHGASEAELRDFVRELESERHASGS